MSADFDIVAALQADIAASAGWPVEQQIRLAIMALDNLDDLGEDMHADGLAIIREILVQAHRKAIAP